MKEIFVRFLILGVTAFGGPTAHIGYFRHAFVEKYRWLNDAQFAQLLSLSQFVPGPASSQLGFMLGYQRGGIAGALAAFVGFTLPSSLLMFGFAKGLTLLTGSATAVIHGLKLTACIIVADAVLTMFRNLCPDIPRRIIGLAALIAVLLINTIWLYMAIIILAALAGWLLCSESAKPRAVALRAPGPVVGVCLLSVFLLLFVSLPLVTGPQPGPLSVFYAFYQPGALVFGGGHVVLPMLQSTVVDNGWISSDAFLAGYGMVQGMPGPLFTLSTYLGALIPTSAPASTIALLATAGLFLPGFLLVMGILPFWSRLIAIPGATNALAGANASVVGILAAVWVNSLVLTSVTGLIDVIIVVLGFLALRKASMPVWLLIAVVTGLGFLAHYVLV